MHDFPDAVPALLPAARAGSADAWELLLRRHQIRLFAYARELLRDEQAALDAVQETFVAAVRHLGSLRDDRKFASWLFGILHQKCQQQGRRRGRDARWLAGPSENPDESRTAAAADDGPDPSEALVRQEDADCLFRVLGGLPAHQRAILLLRFLDDFALSEIAAITDVPLGTVKSRLHDARRAFRKLWESACHENAA